MELKIKSSGFGTVYLIVTFSLFIVGIFFFSYTEYHVDRQNFYRHIDDKLRTAALVTDTVLTPEFHDRARESASISSDEHSRNVERLSNIAKNLNVIYIYTMVQRNGKIYFTSSSATDEERKTGVNLTHYFERYDDPSKELKKVFGTSGARYDEYTDKWGTFRSIFLPMKSPGGEVYVVAADIRTDVIYKQLNDEMYHLLMRLSVMLLLALPFLAWHFRRMSEEKIHHLSHFDSLTQLPNRTHLESYFQYLQNLVQRTQSQLAVMFIDLDHFKAINDSLGHKIGDDILIETAKRLKELVRDTDIVARFSADEFVIVFSINDADGAEKVARKILHTIHSPYFVDSGELKLTVSVGIALYPQDGSTLDSLIKNADTALYRAKRDGRNSYRFVTEEMQTKSFRYLQLSNAIHNALKNGELRVVYQPQISTKTGQIIWAEALLRWKHPELGDISPVEFIPIAEETGLILPIGEWVLRTAITQASIWRKEMNSSMMIAVNLSAVQFRHPKLIETVMQILEEVGFPPEYLELELTESMAMHNPELAINIMDTFHKHGIRMSIDDFGTGYSSLSYLKQFKIYKLKIDQSFIRDICTNTDDKAITSAIIHMAQSLGFLTIAEGVERVEQLAFLREQGCDEIQGYYYSKPCSVEEFQFFVKNYKPLGA